MELSLPQSTLWISTRKKTWSIKKSTFPFWKWVIHVDVPPYLFLTVVVSLYSACIIIWNFLFNLIWIFCVLNILKWIYSLSHRNYPKIKYSSDKFKDFKRNSKLLCFFFVSTLSVRYHKTGFVGRFVCHMLLENLSDGFKNTQFIDNS